MKFAVALLLLALTTTAPNSFAGKRSFSAEAVQTAPGIATIRVKMYVAEDKSVRIEMSTPQGEIVQQFVSNSGTMRVLYPARKEYLEQQSPAPFILPSSTEQSPCNNRPDMNCENVGNEKVNGQDAVHWIITRLGPDKPQFKIEQWQDIKRGITLREKLPNGTTIDANMVGTEKTNGRDAERWEVVMTSIDGKKQTGTRWYDVELGITIREAFPNGSVRELTNIVVKEPDASLFALPKGYKKIDLTTQPQRR